MSFIMSIIRKETSMIKATINNELKRNIFAKSKTKLIARGSCISRPNVRGIVLENYKYIGSGQCVLEKNQTHDNVILFTKQKEVA